MIDLLNPFFKELENSDLRSRSFTPLLLTEYPNVTPFLFCYDRFIGRGTDRVPIK